jgi:hypothetical protein
MSDSKFPAFAMLGLIVVIVVLGRDWVSAHTQLIAPIAIVLGLVFLNRARSSDSGERQGGALRAGQTMEEKAPRDTMLGKYAPDPTDNEMVPCIRCSKSIFRRMAKLSNGMCSECKGVRKVFR